MVYKRNVCHVRFCVKHVNFTKTKVTSAHIFLTWKINHTSFSTRMVGEGPPHPHVHEILGQTHAVFFLENADIH